MIKGSLFKDVLNMGDSSSQPQPRPVPELRSVTDWKNFGNKQFVLKKYHEALKAYNVGLSLLKNLTDDPDLLANRAAAYLNLEHYRKALNDTDLILKDHPTHAKAIYRKARALLGLSKCQEAVSFLRSEIKKQNNSKKPNKDLQELLERGEGMRAQQLTKEYDVTEHFYNYFTRIENWSEYYGPVDVRTIPGKGRGLIATADIGEGELIFASRAFAIEFYNPEGEEDDLDEEDCILEHPAIKALHDRGGCRLAQRIYQRIKEDEELGKEVFQLYAGPELGSLDPGQGESCPVSQYPERISGIVRYNCFANSDDHAEGEKSSGLWIIPSYFNHLCVAQNCTWRIFGNFIIVRAYHLIKKGEELLISYASPTWTMKVRQGLLQERLGFLCFCDLCKMDLTLKPEVILLREKLQKLALKQQVEFVGLNPDIDPTEIYKKFEESSSLLIQILKRLEDMHPSHGILNVLCVDPLQQLGMKYFGVGEFEKAAEAMLKAHAIMKAVGLPHGAVECMLWVVGSYLQIGDTKTAKQFIQVLKKDALLAHGTLKTLRMMGEWVVNAMEENNMVL